MVEVDAPAAARRGLVAGRGHGRLRETVEYRPGKGFGLHTKETGYGEGQAEIYRTPERAVKRLQQLMTSADKKIASLGLRDIREFMAIHKLPLPKKAGVRQPAISRFRKTRRGQAEHTGGDNQGARRKA